MSSSSMRVRTIAKKELVEFVRDWRTIVAILVISFDVPCSFIPRLLASEAAELDSILVDVVVQSDGSLELTGLLDNASLSLVHEPLLNSSFCPHQPVMNVFETVRLTCL